MHKELGYSTEEIFNICDTLLSDKALTTCYTAIGREISAKYLSLEDWEGLASECKNATNPDADKLCVLGGLLAVVDMRLSQGFELCQALDEEYKVSCYGTTGKFIKTLELSLEEIEEKCAMSESPEYSQLCYSEAVKKL